LAAGEVAPIDDLRRNDGERESWAPPKIKKREAEVQRLEGEGTLRGGDCKRQAVVGGAEELRPDSGP
jgi:hypothetical protein